MPIPWVSLRQEVNKAVNEKEQLEKGAGRRGGKKTLFLQMNGVTRFLSNPDLPKANKLNDKRLTFQDPNFSDRQIIEKSIY
jgi:hypothetical protein